MLRKVLMIAMVLVLSIMMTGLFGCDAGMTITAKAFYPKENGGEIWKSRQANPEKPVWSWGNAGQ